MSFLKKIYSAGKTKKRVAIISLLAFGLILAGILVFVLQNQKNSDTGAKQTQKIFEDTRQSKQAELEKTNPGFVDKKQKSIDEGVKSADDESFSTEQKSINYYFLAGDYESIGDYENAIKMYEKVLQSNEPVYLKNTYIEIGDLYVKLGLKDKAIESYNLSKENIMKYAKDAEQKMLLGVVDSKIKEAGL